MNPTTISTIQQLKDALEKSKEGAPEPDVFNAINRELSVLNRLNSEFKWQLLSDAEKQQRRKNLYNSLHNADAESYEGLVIQLYDMIVTALARLEDLDSEVSNIYLTRVKAMLFVEKEFINESMDADKLRHNDYYILMNVLDAKGQKAWEELKLHDIKQTFDKMYRAWSKRPYKEIV